MTFLGVLDGEGPEPEPVRGVGEGAGVGISQADPGDGVFGLERRGSIVEAARCTHQLSVDVDGDYLSGS